MTSPTSSDEQYILHYWPEIPGRGEYVRLAFEAAARPYVDDTDVSTLTRLSISTADPVGHPAHFAPPILEVVPPSNGGNDGTKRLKNRDGLGVPSGSAEADSFFLSQTPAILAYLAPKLDLLGDMDGLDRFERELRQAHVQQLTSTALDLSNEVHDSHHPIAVSLTYEEQQVEAKRRADDLKQNRVPKFFRYFDLTIQANADAEAEGRKRLIGGRTTVADLTLFQVVDGLKFALPRYMESLQKDGRYAAVFELHDQLSKELEAYLKSDRRRAYSNGLFRHYEELDGEAPKAE